MSQQESSQHTDRSENAKSSVFFLWTMSWGKIISVIALIIAMGGIVWTGVQATRTEDTGISVNLSEAKTIAEKYLSDRGVDTSVFVRGVAFRQQPGFMTKAKYIAWFGGQEDFTNAFDKTGWEQEAWTIQYSKEESQRAINVTVSPQGDVVKVDQQYPEAAEGGNLSKEKAREKVLSYLESERGISSGQITEERVETTERENRTDHIFTYHFTEEDWNVKDANLGFTVEVEGQTVNGFSPFIKTPEAWNREHLTPNGWQIGGAGLSLLGILVALGVGVWFVLSGLRSGEFDSRAGKWAAVLYVAVDVLSTLNAFPQFWLGFASGANTSLSLNMFIGIAVVGQIIRIGFLAFLMFVAVGFGLGVWKSRISPRFGFSQLYSADRGWNIQTVLAWLGVPLVIGGLEMANGQAMQYIADKWSIFMPFDTDTSLLSGVVDTYVPAIAPVLSVIGLVLSLIFTLGFAVMLKTTVRRWWIAILILGALVAVPGGTFLSFAFPLETVGLLIASSVFSAVIALIWIFGVLRTHLLAYVIGIAELILLQGGLNLLVQPDTWLSGNGGVLLIVLAVLVGLGVPFLYQRGMLPPQTEEEAGPKDEEVSSE